MIELKSLLCWN